MRADTLKEREKAMSEILSFTYEPSGGGNACAITLSRAGDGFVLRWSDFVANEWEENYGSLSVALVRVAALVRCGESGWAQGFVSDAQAFQVAAGWFLAGVAR